MRPAALEVRALRKVYGGTVALADASLSIRQGEIHAFVGENGAGKSTLVRAVAGIEHADGGTVSYFGHELPASFSAADVRAAGAAFIHQDMALVPNLTVAENVALVTGYPRRWGVIDWRRGAVDAHRVIAEMGVDLDVREPVANLPVATQAVVAIARALALDARLLVLDEPTATLPEGEARQLHAIMRRLRERGVSCVLISHRLDEVLEVCDRVTVLRDGHVVATRDTAGLAKVELMRLMMGHVPHRTAARARSGRGRERITLDAIAAPGIGPISLSVHAGEVLGLTGLAGSGYLALAELVFGQRRPAAGGMRLDGDRYAPRSPAAAIAAGVSLVPADRNAAAALPRLSLRENLFPNPTGTGALRIGRERATAQAVLEDFNVRPPRPDAEMSTLSGGNAQKVVLARCLTREPRVILLCEPTAAVDVGTRADIHDRMRRVSAEGAAVVIASSDIEELAEVADRVAVLRAGRVASVLEGAGVSTHDIRVAVHGNR